MMSFRIDKKSLEINGREIIFECPINLIVFLNDTFFILFESNNDNKSVKQFHNLWAVNSETEILWRADFPVSLPDSYLNIYIKDDKLHAYSFTGYDCIIDLLTGKVVYSELCK